jgi:signal transduction histidine kinase
VLAELRRLLKAHDDFLSVASHELKTPLTVLKLKVQNLLRRRTNVDASRVAEELSNANRQIDRLTSLMEMMLDVTRVESGKLSLETERVDLAAVLREMGARHTEEATRARSSLAVRVPESLFCVCDRARIEQVVGHLLRNAITHCEGSEVVLELEQVGSEAAIRVRDRGAGIESADHVRIFGRFERAASARHFGGLGLGLWLSDAIVKAHGGRITVVSAPGQGSTFEVRLPVVSG